MIFMGVMVLMNMMISMVLILINMMFSKKMIEDREKKSSYECGFDSYNSSRLPYSVHFFLISMVFLIFDIELSLLFPVIFSYECMKLSMMMIYLMFLLIFIMGLFIEWFEGSLIWKK